MKFLYLLLLLAFVSCNTALEQIACIVQNDKVLEQATNVIKAIKTKNIQNIIVTAFRAYLAVKDIVKECLVDEPVLQVGCRYEVQFKECKMYSCEYMDQYECDEYCYRKYC